MSENNARKLTVRDLWRRREQGGKIVCLTAYDALMAGLAEAAGVHLVLVGDSLGMTNLGYPTTLPVTLEQSLLHTAAVVRGTTRPLVVGDMPFMTYHLSPEQALANAARYLQEAGADAVKLEGGQAMAPTVRRLVEAGVPVLGHIGLLPQHVKAAGGHFGQGKTAAAAAALLADALALEAAGAFAVVLECVKAEVAATITGRLTVPTIGIGSGAGCSGQVQVLYDILGLSGRIPKHAKVFADARQVILGAFTAYREAVEQGSFPGPEQAF
jgi:3-methyl-2-oxobutanoate hydroxymethyltransferase